VLSFACTIIRETFNTWTPVYLREHLGYSASHSASMSAVFPGVGVASVLLAGWLSDRLGLSGRSLLMLVGLAATAAALVALMSVRPGPAAALPGVALIGVVAFGLLGPYSYLGGAFALDFGGKQASAVSSGIIDGIGYLGGVLAGDTVARVAVDYGWQGVFVSLAAVSAVAAVCAGVLHALNTRAARARATLAAAAAETTGG
jgi:sugar phosphate permease